MPFGAPSPDFFAGIASRAYTPADANRVCVPVIAYIQKSRIRDGVRTHDGNFTKEIGEKLLFYLH